MIQNSTRQIMASSALTSPAVPADMATSLEILACVKSLPVKKRTSADMMPMRSHVASGMQHTSYLFTLCTLRKSELVSKNSCISLRVQEGTYNVLSI